MKRLSLASIDDTLALGEALGRTAIGGTVLTRGLAIWQGARAKAGAVSSSVAQQDNFDRGEVI